MLIEEGRFYRTRDGYRAGPMKFDGARWSGRVGYYRDKWDWPEGGAFHGDGIPHGLDLVAEWVSPKKKPSPDQVALIQTMRHALLAAAPVLVTSDERPGLQARIEAVEAAIAKADAYLAEVPPCD